MTESGRRKYTQRESLLDGRTGRSSGGRTDRQIVRRTDRQILEAWKKANVGKDRRDLVSDNWDGDVYRGTGFNILNLLVLLFFLVPAVGILVAYKGYGVWWG